MEVTARRGERSAAERCPYCHDALAGAPSASPDDLVACPGCATQHHRACVEELGRCTIRGCERPLAPGPEADPLAGRLRRSSVTEEVRRRVRARARTFLAAHCAPAPVRPRVFDRSPEEEPLRVRDVGALREPTDFDAALVEALELSRTGWFHERPAACRCVAALLRSDPGRRFTDAEEVAAEHDRRAHELEALFAHYRARPGPSYSALGLLLLVPVLLALALIQLLRVL